MAEVTKIAKGINVREKIPDSGVFWVFVNYKGQRQAMAVGDQQAATETAEKIKAMILLGQFEIKRSISKGSVTTPKSGKSRSVDVSLQLAATLGDHMTDCKAKGLELGLGAMPEYLFTNNFGHTIDIDNFRNRVLKKH